MNLTLTMS